jgi:hypothetical protein
MSSSDSDVKQKKPRAPRKPADPRKAAMTGIRKAIKIINNVDNVSVEWLNTMQSFLMAPKTVPKQVAPVASPKKSDVKAVVK